MVSPATRWFLSSRALVAVSLLGQQLPPSPSLRGIMPGLNVLEALKQREQVRMSALE